MERRVKCWPQHWGLIILTLVIFALLGRADQACPEPARLPPQYQNKLGMRLNLITGGSYLIGSPLEEPGRYLNEGPQHRVTLSPFYITATEITNAQYSRFLAASGCPAPLYWLDKNLNAPDQPVVGVSWHDAVAFAKWLSRETGETYRLPTEAEWEAAARGGLVGQPFPWGAAPPNARSHFRANYNPNTYADDGYRYSAPVGRFPANGYGLFDLAGNVAEWCQDWYEAAYYKQSPRENPPGPPSGRFRVLRGGSWYSRARDLRCACRQFAAPHNADGFIGFRLVRIIQP
ncbi:MAG: formylglycine-generating enzyme family protein [Deltaproteobacteria bacterium]|nr:formylglycine-generating enzyme family protein [Deltaproteobacteria bacterium]MBW1953039.1 formylglycine-generating enzyme family protein [Deltaproteobacteria bacterium]MBW1985969.1 formylglycine-generating enzyme family protein [Deltaproteobacteria bacterium]MBW2135472.1 formylglycine-generating enzyme family protein [Deltaproteobacteria bacterium]